MYYEIDMTNGSGGQVHCIVEGPVFDPNDVQYPYKMIECFKNTRGWPKEGLGISGDWIVKGDTEIKRKYPEYFI